MLSTTASDDGRRDQHLAPANIRGLNLIRIGTAFDDQGDGDPANDTGQGKTFIAGIDNQTLTVSADEVCIESTGQLGRCNVPSSRRYKYDIQAMGAGAERLLELRPVTYRFKEEVAGQEEALQFGLVAEEVAEVLPELVVFDNEGRPESVKYRFLSSILLNEVQRQAEELRDVRARLRAVEKKLLE
jgi:hypothetical protein